MREQLQNFWKQQAWLSSAWDRCEKMPDGIAKLLLVQELNQRTDQLTREFKNFVAQIKA